MYHPLNPGPTLRTTLEKQYILILIRDGVTLGWGWGTRAYMSHFVPKQPPLQLPRNEALYEQNPENLIYTLTRSSGLADMRPASVPNFKRHYGCYPGVRHSVYTSKHNRKL